MVGQTISHYRIIRKLGEGGMSEVYQAEDTKLKRTVALKFMRTEDWDDDDLKRRFVREAQAAAALDHPNICTVHEIDENAGQLFISMAFNEGQDLREKLLLEPLSVAETLDISIQVARGLEAAHKRGVRHCDVKSANIMVSDDGHVKVTDFGLAQVLGRANLTASGRTAGTMAYMSPEQVRGDDLDHRTDIWSVGVCMYEMLTGELPFKGEYGPAVFYSIASEDPTPIVVLRPEVPEPLCRVVDKTLAKNRDDRYEDMSALIADLERVRGAIASAAAPDNGSSAPRQSIAVLPFADMSRKKDQEFLCDGIAEEIINALTKVEGLRVVARTSAFSFKNEKVDIREVGKQLDVTAVLEGSIRKAGDQIRITAQLIDTTNGYHLWSERYDRQLEDVFAIQDDISQAIVDMLKVRLIADEEKTLFKHYTADFEAYTLYLKGRFYWNKRTDEGLRKGMECFEQAIAKDPQYALAYAGLADSFNLLGFYSVLPPKVVFPKAKEAARTALAMDETLAEAHASLAFAHMFHDWDWREAELEFKRAIELNPKCPTAHHWYAEFLVLVGRMGEAVAQAKRALESDPLSLIINTLLGWVPHFDRRFDEAEVQYRRTLELDRTFVPAHFFLGLTLIQQVRFDEAIEEFKQALFRFGPIGLHIAVQGIAHARAGNESAAREILAQLTDGSSHGYVPLYYVAAICAALGEYDVAFARLDEASEQRDTWMAFLLVDPIWDNVRGDARFTELLEKVGLCGSVPC